MCYTIVSCNILLNRLKKRLAFGVQAWYAEASPFPLCLATPSLLFWFFDFEIYTKQWKVS